MFLRRNSTDWAVVANVSGGNDTTRPHPAPILSASQVSWQSAFWAVVACSINAMMQSTGRTCGFKMRFSAVLRCSPFFCLVDTLEILIRFLFLLAVGCSPTTAARHVWYDRFALETPSSVESTPVRADVIHNSLPAVDSPTEEYGEEGIPLDDVTPSSIQQAPELGQIVSSSIFASGALHSEPILHSASDDGNNQQTLSTTTSSLDEGIVSIEGTSNVWAPEATPTAPINECVSAGQESHSGDMSSTSEIYPPAQEIQDSEAVEHLIAITPGGTHCTGFYPGSSIDRPWRYSMVAFFVGALPQMIKVFSMRGVPFTQATVGVFLVSFFVPEVLRQLAGTAGQVELHPMPIVIRMKKLLTKNKVIPLTPMIAFTHMLWAALGVGGLFGTPKIKSIAADPKISRVIAVCVTMPTIIALSVIKFWQQFRLYDCIWYCISRTQRGRYVLLLLRTRHKSFVRLVHEVFLLPREIKHPAVAWSFLYTLAVFPFLFGDMELSGTCDGPRIWIVLCVLIAIIGLPILNLHFVFFLSFFFYRMLFVGSLSKYPRTIFGVNGSLIMFFSGMFVMVYFWALLYYYSQGYKMVGGRLSDEWDSTGTYKPGWAEYLG